VKLLFDENLSYRAQLATVFPGSEHVDLVGLHLRTAIKIWNFAGNNGFTIVTKDNDFRQRSSQRRTIKSRLVVDRQCRNSANSTTLVDSSRVIEAFFRDADDSLLILELPAD